MATSEGIPSSIDIEFLELNDNPYSSRSFLIKLNLLILLEEKVVGSLKCLYLCIRYYELVA